MFCCANACVPELVPCVIIIHVDCSGLSTIVIKNVIIIIIIIIIKQQKNKKEKEEKKQRDIWQL